MAQQNFTVDYGITITGTDGNIDLPAGTPAIQTPDQTGTISLKVQGGNTERSMLEIGSDGGTDQFVYISSIGGTGNRISFDMGAYAGNPAYAQIQTYDGTSVTNSWLFTTAPLDPTEAYLYVPGGAAITTPNATGGGAGQNIFIEAGAADQSDYYTTAGGELYLKGGRGATNDGGGGGPGGAVNINAGESADPAGVAGNVYITAGALKQWVFDNNGNLTAPGNISTTANVTAGNLSVTGNVVGNINFTGGDVLINNATGAGGSDEGGELHFAAATANSTLSGPIAIDIYQNKMRFFETEGNTFGMFIDIANSMGVAGSSLGVPAIGYRDVPQISLSANVTANVTNAGKHFYSTTAGNITLTIPDNANVAFPTGATLTIVMNAAGNVIVAQGTGVSLYMAGSSTTGNRVVGAYGLASVMKVATDTWVISGTGVY